MDTQRKQSRKRLRRRRRPIPKKHFQASFLHRRIGESVSPIPVSTEEQEAFAAETFARLRLRSPPTPIDYRNRFSRIPEELQLNSQIVRRTLSQSAVSLRRPQRPSTAGDPRGEAPKPVHIPPNLHVSGLSATVAEKGKVVQRPASSNSQTYFRYEKVKKVSIADVAMTDRLQVKYFNAEIIPKKQERTVTMSDIQKYLHYIGSKPFR